MEQAVRDLELFIENPNQLQGFQLHAKEFMIREIAGR
jgi:hypothetical protein